MRKKDKLYTVTKFNRPLFVPKSNLFYDGGTTLGALPSGVSVIPSNYQSPTIGIDTNKFNQQVSNTGNFVNGYAAGLNNSSKEAPTSTGLKAAGPALISAGAGIVGDLSNKAISGGLESKAGSAISNIGGTVGSAVGAVNPIAGAAITVGSQLIGGLANRAFGIKTNQKALNEANAGTSALNNFVSDAGSFDDIKELQAVSNVGNVYKGGWFSGKKARKKNEELKNQRIDAHQFATRSIENNVDNLVADQMNNAFANYAAYGGPLFNNSNDMGAIEYGFMSDYLDTKKKNADNKNQMTNMFMGIPNSMFAFGGDLQTHGGDFGTGMTHIDTGGSHEDSPYDGVQMGVDQEGTPNLVEEGETVYDDYVFSNRILADDATKKLFHLPKKKDITFAEISKRLEKEISERPNDPLSKAGFKAQMQTLEEQQERQKQEMEAERARAAFEALSPEEQTAIMQNAAQQAAQEQAIAEQQAMQQPSPEEVQMMQQQAMQADGTEANLGAESPMMAEGGHLYAEGGNETIRNGLFKALGLHTMQEFENWAKEHSITLPNNTNNIKWRILARKIANDALIKTNPALADAIRMGYDFGAYQPLADGKATIKSIGKGNWKATNGEGWFGSEDPAWLEAIKDMDEEDIMNLSSDDVAKLLKATNSYKKGNEWLQNKDNALLYLNTLMNDLDTPQEAKDYAAKFIKDGQWKEGFNYDYATVFGSNGKGVRETNPGTYWHTPMEAVRGNQSVNWVLNDDGTIDEIYGDVPTDWTSAGSYSWITPSNNITSNYYRRPAVAVTPEEMTVEVETPKEENIESEIEPAKKADWMRYAGLFGPAVGLGMQMAGIGKPNYSDLNAAVSSAGNAHLATYKPLGNYLTYRPMDIWFEQNRMDANARATDRAIMNSSSPSKMAGLLASGYNSQIADGELYRKALEYNDAKRKDVAEFNRGTDQFNAEAFNRLSQFNASALNDAASRNTNARLHAAQQKLANDAGWYNSLYGNVSGLFKGISDLGRENAMFNVLAKQAADGVYGNTGDSYTGSIYTKKQKKKSNGGRVNKKKGLTY